MGWADPEGDKDREEDIPVLETGGFGSAGTHLIQTPSWP